MELAPRFNTETEVWASLCNACLCLHGHDRSFESIQRLGGSDNNIFKGAFYGSEKNEASGFMTIAINELVLCSFHPNVVLPVSEECILLLKKRNVYSWSKRGMYTSMVTQALEQDMMKQNGWDACFITVLPGIMNHCARIDGYHSLDKWSVLNRAWSMSYGSLELELLSISGLPDKCATPWQRRGRRGSRTATFF